MPAWKYGGFGLNFTAADPSVYRPWIPPRAYPKTPLRPGDPVEDFVAKPIDIGDQTGIQRYLNQETNIRVGLGTGDVISYQDRTITPTGSVAISTTPQE